MTLLDNMPHRCTIRLVTRARGGMIGSKDTSTEVSTGNECWSQAATQTEVEEFEKRGMKVNRKVYFPSDPGLTEQNEIVMTSYDRGTTTIANQVPLEVRLIVPPDASAGMRRVWKVFAEEHTGRKDSA